MPYFAYLDEFGHIGPFVSASDEKYKESPAFGLGGMILPHQAVRSFGTWFFQQKSRLLDFEIQRAGTHPATWEKKAPPYTLSKMFQNIVANVNQKVHHSDGQKMHHFGGRIEIFSFGAFPLVA